MLKKLIQGLLRLVGLKLSRMPTEEQIKQAAEEEARKNLWLQNIEIKTVLDIGANTGQFVSYIRDILPDARIYSFEPLADCYKELIANFGNQPNFEGFNLALGNQTGRVEIHRNEFSPSSSLLNMAPLHKEAFPYTQKEVIQPVNIAKLDEFVANLNLEKPILIKIDVQGFENEVIMGGINTLVQAEVLIIELSLEPLYEGQMLFDEIYQKLVSLRFVYRGNIGQIINPQDGRILQVDAIFRKT
ncbi:MAG: FkbM family methyltransferase [Phormidium sp.]